MSSNEEYRHLVTLLETNESEGDYDMNCKDAITRRVNPRNALEQTELAEHETARPPLACSSICNCFCADGLNEGDLLIITRDSKVLSRQREDVTIHVETESVSISVDVRRLDNPEPQILTPDSQPSSKTSPDRNAVGDEKAQNRNGVKRRFWGMMGKIQFGVQAISGAINIVEFICKLFS